MNLNNLKLSYRLGLGFSVLLALMLATAGMGIWRLDGNAVLTDRIVRVDGQRERLLRQWIGETKANAVRAVVVSRSGDAELEQILKPEIEAATKRISELQKQVDPLLQDSESKVLFADIGEKRKAYIETRNAAAASKKAGKAEESVKIVDSQMIPAVETYVASMQTLVDYQMHLTDKNGEEAAASAVSGRVVLIAGVLAALAAGIVIAWLLARSIAQPLRQAVEIADAMAAGDLSRKIEVTRKDEMGKLLASLKTTQASVQALVTDAAELAEAAVAGQLSTRADASRHQGDFRKVVEGVNHTLDAVTGPLNVAASYVDQISKGAIPAKITDSYSGDFNTLKNNLNMAIDAIHALVADAAALSQAAVEGKLETRADAGKHQGDFRKIVEGVNNTLDAVIGPLNVAASYVDQISKGAIPKKITD
ncbi:MAG: MCP four helix bundle domain-containing protein, partial [Proteobacteria bacterium]|nr:MCP four helix bundle domain-containing protein [Pseudomonadota bacterium]